MADNIGPTSSFDHHESLQDPTTTGRAADDSRRSSINNHRRVSYRTETLIHEAARSVVSNVEPPKQGREKDLSESPLKPVPTITKGSSRSSHPHSGAPHRSQPSNARSNPKNNLVSVAGDSSSSPHDSDIFSEHSGRSSIGSSSSSNPKINCDIPLSSAAEDQPLQSPNSLYAPSVNEDDILTDSRRPSHTSFIPANIKMTSSSPEPSVWGGGGTSSPRSIRSRRAGRFGHSPSNSAQYSTKNRSTPPRLKRREPQPLVLLHVTLLPLRWQWADLIAATSTGDMSQSCRTLRENWRLLQENVGDTLLERGILLPHPQDDYEVLEERLLDALELPVRKRARILECGHYVGYSNMMAGDLYEPSEDEGDYEDVDTEDSGQDADESVGGGGGVKEKRRWCHTCRCDIKYEDLGPGKVFRLKAYASNGLISAGAWDACWKEMERVDVVLEPLVDKAVQGELEHLELVRQGLASRPQHHMDPDGSIHTSSYLRGAGVVEEHLRNEAFAERPSMLSSPVPPMSSPGFPASPTPDTRRRLDDERLREIYGRTPPVSVHERLSRVASPTPSRGARGTATTDRPVPTTEDFPPSSYYAADTNATATEQLDPRSRHPDRYMPPTSPPSPTAQAFERRELRQQHQQQEGPPTTKALPQDASLGQLLVQAGKVAVQDRRNVAIFLLSLLVLVFALRPQRPVGDAAVDPELRRQILAMNNVNNAPHVADVGSQDTTSSVGLEVPVAKVDTATGQDLAMPSVVAGDMAVLGEGQKPVDSPLELPGVETRMEIGGGEPEEDLTGLEVWGETISETGVELEAGQVSESVKGVRLLE